MNDLYRRYLVEYWSERLSGELSKEDRRLIQSFLKQLEA